MRGGFKKNMTCQSQNDFLESQETISDANKNILPWKKETQMIFQNKTKNITLFSSTCFVKFSKHIKFKNNKKLEGGRKRRVLSSYFMN